MSTLQIINNNPNVVVIERRAPLVMRPLYGAGAQGPAGPQGPAGGAGFDFVQSTPVTTQIINHNLGRRVNTALFTIGGIKLIAEIINLNLNQVQVTFNSITAFVAIIT